MIAVLAITYAVLSFLAALVFYGACIVAGRADRRDAALPEKGKQHGNT